MKIHLNSKFCVLFLIIFQSLLSISEAYKDCSQNKNKIIFNIEDNYYPLFQPSCSESYQVLNENFTTPQNLELYSHCSTEELSKFFKSDGSIVSLALLLDSLGNEKFQELVFTRRFRESTIWNENLLISAVNLIGAQNFCGSFLDFMLSLDFGDAEKTTMGLHILQRMSISAAAELNLAEWIKIEEFLRKVVDVLSNERRVFSLEAFDSKIAARLLFLAYRSKGLRGTETVYLSENFKKSFSRFLAGTDASIFDIIRPQDIVEMIENDINNHFTGFIQNNPDFGAKIYNKLVNARNPRSNAPYRRSLMIRMFMENPNYYNLFSPFVDPNSYANVFDRGQSGQNLQHSKWFPVTFENSRRGFLFKRFFTLNTVYDEKFVSSTSDGFPVLQLLCVLTNEQFNKVLSTTRNSLRWLDEPAYVPIDCFDEIKASKIVKLKSERFEMGILPTSYAEKLKNFGHLLPFIDWTIFTGNEITSAVARSFLCSDGCKYCTASQKSILAEKAAQNYNFVSKDGCDLMTLSSDLLGLSDVNSLPSDFKDESRSKNLERWQRLKMKEIRPRFVLHDPKEIDFLKSPWELSQKNVSNFLQKLEPMLRQISEKDLEIHSKSITDLVKNYLQKSHRNNNLGEINVFGVQILPVKVLLAFTQDQWPKYNRRQTCQEFIGKISASAEIESELWVKRNLLANHYLENCPVHDFNSISQADIAILNKLSCDLGPNQIEKLDYRVVIENLSIFGKCCFSPGQLTAFRKVIGPISNWEPHWFIHFGDLTCEIIDDQVENFETNQLEQFEGLAVAEILTYQRSCNAKSSLILGYEFINQDAKFEKCMKNVTKMTLDKLEIKHYQILGWRDPSCRIENAKLTTSLRTCAALMSVGGGIRYAKTEEFEHLSNCEFEACIHYFGFSKSITADQGKYILNRASNAIPYAEYSWFDAKDKVLELLYLVPFAETETLIAILSSKWADLNFIKRLLTVDNWSKNQYELINKKYEVLIGGKWTKNNLVALIPIAVCYINIKSINPQVLLDFIPVGRKYVSNCENSSFFDNYFQTFFENHDKNYLTPGDVQMLGNIMSGLSSSFYFESENVPEISTSSIQSWREDLLEDLVTNFAAYLTPDQIKTLILSEKISDKNHQKLLSQVNLGDRKLKTVFENENLLDLSENSGDSQTSSENQGSSDNRGEVFEVTGNPAVKLEIVYIVAGSESFFGSSKLIIFIIVSRAIKLLIK